MKEVQLNVQMVVYDERYIKYTIRRTTDKQFYIHCQVMEYKVKNTDLHIKYI